MSCGGKVILKEMEAEGVLVSKNLLEQGNYLVLDWVVWSAVAFDPECERSPWCQL